MAIKRTKHDEMFVTVHVGDDINTVLFKLSQTALFESQLRPLRDQLQFAVEASTACRGFKTNELQAMNAHDRGTLHRAYEVCKAFDSALGELLENDEPIVGSDAVDVLADQADKIIGVTKWER